MDTLNNIATGSPNPQLGYKINALEKAVYHAVRDAYDQVITARDKGAKIRTWVMEASKNIDSLISWAEDFQLNGLMNGMNKIQVQQKISELGSQEGKILRVVHHYLGESHLIKKKLNLLNPPLNSAQLQPFFDAVEEDRQKTITSLEILTSHLENLTKLKMAICKDFQRLFSEF